MKQHLLIITLIFIFISCSHKYLPIVRTNRNYPPTNHAEFVESVPASAIYIGTIKVVPRDYSFQTGGDYQTAIRNMQETAANAGARYIYVTYVTAPNKDFYYGFFNAITQDFGEGFTIEAELYR